jgi:hypothetical protein
VIAIKKGISLSCLFVILLSMATFHAVNPKKNQTLIGQISEPIELISEYKSDKNSHSKTFTAVSSISGLILVVFFLESIFLNCLSVKDILMKTFLLAPFYQSSYFRIHRYV